MASLATKAAILGGGAVGVAVLLREFRKGPKFVRPVPGTVTSGWGDARSGHLHAGIDIRAPAGSPVVAFAGGTVLIVRKSSAGSAGRFVAVEHRLPGLGRVVSRYLHLDEVSARAGAKVAPGSRLGTVGRTGVERSAAHLHFDLHVCTEEGLRAYVQRYGRPELFFEASNVPGCRLVPAEPLVPVDGYADRVRRAARSRGVRLRG